MRHFVPSKMQAPEQIQEAAGHRFASGVFEERTRRLKAPADDVVIRRGQADLNLDRRGARAKLPGAVARKTQGRCLGLEPAHDLANRVQVEVTDRDSPVGSQAAGPPARPGEPASCSG